VTGGGMYGMLASAPGWCRAGKSRCQDARLTRIASSTNGTHSFRHLAQAGRPVRRPKGSYGSSSNQRGRGKCCFGSFGLF